MQKYSFHILKMCRIITLVSHHSFYSHRRVCVCVCFAMGHSVSRSNFYQHSGTAGWGFLQIWSKVPAPPSLIYHPSAVGGLKGYEGEGFRGSLTFLITPSHKSVRVTGLMWSSSAPTHQRWEKHQEGGQATRKERAFVPGGGGGEGSKSRSNNQKDFVFTSGAATEPRWRMAEGGEGEEEIQFLRTVSAANLFLLGRPNLHVDWWWWRDVGRSCYENEKWTWIRWNPDLSLLISASGVAAMPVFLQTDYFCSAINVPWPAY